MGKKGSWFSAIKRVFNPNSKEKPINGPEKSNREKKKRGLGKLRHSETNSFIPLFREPSSIEKILGDAEREYQKILIRPPTPSEPPKPPPSLPPRLPSPRVPSPRVASPKAASPRVASPKVSSPGASSHRVLHHRNKEVSYRSEPTLRNHHVSAVKIQSAFRGYMARRSFRALRGLVRLQGVVRGQNVKRQTMNAMKYMQLLVRVQTQIQSRRIQMLESQGLQRHQPAYKNDKEVESSFGKWTLSQPSEAGNGEEWDDSVLTKEEVDARLQRKVEAVIKRERAMAYAYSSQLWKATSKPSETPPPELRSGAFPWWWNWLERQLPSATQPTNSGVPLSSTPLSKPIIESKPSPRPQSGNNYKTPPFGFDHMESLTPKSSKSAIPTRAKQAQTPSKKFSTVRRSSTFDLKDDDSLTSCPPFSVPNYMAPTVSAKAKVRGSGSSSKERSTPATPIGGGESKRRLSFPLTQTFAGSFKWNRGSFFSNGKDSAASQRGLTKHQSLHAMGNLSVDSTVSLPAGVGRRPFNRFV